MPSIPLPFIVTGALVLLLVRLARRRGNLWFLIFIGACALQTVLVGLRWSEDLVRISFLQPVLAACLPGIALTAFESLRDKPPSPLHFLWPASIFVAWLSQPALIDPLLVLEFTVYGIAIYRSEPRSGDLTRVRIGDEWTISYARKGVAAALVLSAISDVIVSFALEAGERSIAVRAIAATAGAVLIGLAGGFIGRAGASLPDGERKPALAQEPPTTPGPEETEAILKAVDAILVQGLYRDPDLTLQRLARRTRIPARKISEAVNRARGCSITDLVNGYRVREAMRLLRETDMSVTQVMFESGFQTKSNFNRSFKEIAGQPPSAYRRSEN